MSMRALAGYLFLVAAMAPAMTDYDNSPTIGPAKGWLVIHGGGVVTQEVKRRFVAFAGGPSASFIVIPTALGGEIDMEKTARLFESGFGVTHVTVLHTRDRVRANSAGFVEPLRHASGVWIDGGRQWRLADAYLGTAVEREIKALLARGGVVGGSSAGATIQGSFLVRGAPGNARNPDGDNAIMMSPGHETGFGLLANSAIDQHVNTREREADLDSVITAHPDLLGIGIDESAAIFVHGNLFEVAAGQVAIHDGKDHDGARYYFLSSGQTFNLKRRGVAGPAETLQLQPSVSPGAVQEESAADKYPLTLTVTSAMRRVSSGGITTNGIGLLTSKGNASQAPQRITFECDAGVYSRSGMNVYAARVHKPYQIKIAVREIGTDRVHEATCKY